MFVYNVKVNGSKIFKIFFTIVIMLIVCILGIVTFKVFGGANNSGNNSETPSLSCTPNGRVCDISPKNYTNILKAVHDNIDSYIGVKIHFTGYVYRLFDFTENQFVLARDMVISSDFQTVVVGFLCECDTAKDFTNDSWIDITGEIIKGDYHGAIPVIKITNIKNIEKPNEEFVYPPDESYIPTSGLI